MVEGSISLDINEDRLLPYTFAFNVKTVVCLVLHSLEPVSLWVL